MPSASLAALTATTGNKTDCWNTPKEIIDKVLEFYCFKIELDPCSNSHLNPNIPSDFGITEAEDGLSQPWLAETVFLNHPYSDSKRWIPYARQQYDCGNAKEIVMLIKLDISTKWFKSIANFPWVAINKRLKFGDATGAAPFQSAIFYLGPNFNRFFQVFGDLGHCYLPK